MSVKRWSVEILWEDPKGGNFCEYSEYKKLEAENAALKEENERLKSSESINEALLKQQNERLKARVAELESSIPKVCDGNEQEVFEKWAKDSGYNMHQHPLHWLFLDAKTYAAREGWRAALQYVGTCTKEPANEG